MKKAPGKQKTAAHNAHAPAAGIKKFSLPPLGWMAASASIPLILTFYSLASMRISSNLAGITDHLLFIAAFCLAYALIFRIANPFARRVASFALIFGLCAYFAGNLLYFRFYNAFINPAHLIRLDLFPSVAPSIAKLARPADLVFGFIIPAILWAVTMRYSHKLPRRSPLVCLSILTFLAVCHAVIASPVPLYSENNPFINIFRQGAQEAYLHISTDFTLGQIARNSARYQLFSRSLCRKSGSGTYPFEKTPLVSDGDAGPRKLNVVLIVLESVRAFESGAYGSRPSCTPNLDRLAAEGALFRNFYGNSAQTSNAEFSMLSSYYPNYLGGDIYETYPNLSVVTLPQLLKRNGYRTMWISSYTPEYSNKQRFLSAHGVDSFHYDIPHPALKLGWGPSDQDIFDYAFDTISRQKGLFFAEIMTLSNHFPFDYKYPTAGSTPQFPGDATYRNYLKGVYYTDYALGRFFDRVRASGLAKNTVFVITSDNGVWLFPADKDLDNVRREEIFFRLPLLILGPGIKPQASDAVASQLDIAPTVLDLLNLHESHSFLGASLFRNDTAERFAFMFHNKKWNLRSRDTYLYDSESQTFLEHFPRGNISSSLAYKYRNISHDCFTVSGDLLRSGMSGRQACPESVKKTYEGFVRDALPAYLRILYADRISPPNGPGAKEGPDTDYAVNEILFKGERYEMPSWSLKHMKNTASAKQASADGEERLVTVEKLRKEAVLLEKLTEKDAAGCQVYNKLGVLHFRLKNYELAFQEFRKALEINPGFAASHNNLGVLYGRQGFHNNAIDEYKKALALEPDYSDARGNLADQVEILKKAVISDPADKETHYNLGYYYFTEKLYDSAVAELKKTLRLDPGYFEAHNTLGTTYASLQQLDKAAAEFRKAAEIEPFYERALTNLGNVLSQLKDYQGAILAYTRAAQINPNNFIIHYNLGIFYEKAGRYSEAVREYGKALELNPSYTDARNSIDRLKTKHGA